MPANRPMAAPASAGGFAALLPPLASTAPESTPDQDPPSDPSQSSIPGLSDNLKETPSRSEAKANDHGPARRQDSAVTSGNPQAPANPVVPTPSAAAQLTSGPAGSVKQGAHDSASAAAAESTVKNGFATLQPKNLGASAVTAPDSQSDAEGAKAEQSGPEGTVAAMVLNSAVDARGLMSIPFSAAATAAGTDKPKAEPASVQQSAQPQKAAEKPSPETPTHPANGLSPSATVPAAGGPDVAHTSQDLANQEAVASVVKAAVSQATLPSNKGIGIKPAGGHSVEGKSAGVSTQPGDPRASKSSGNESSSSSTGHETASGQNQAKKNGESDELKGAEFTAHFDAGQPKPVVAHDPAESAGPISLGQVPVSSSSKDQTGLADSPQAPASAHAPALPGTPAEDGLPEGSLVHSTALLDQLGHSELKVGMRMGDLGNVEIRTQMHDQQLKAEISVEHHDLGRILTNELPALQQRLQQSNVSLTSVMVRDHGAGNNGGGSQGESRGQQFGFAPQAAGIAAEHVSAMLSPEEVREGSGALDIRI